MSPAKVRQTLAFCTGLLLAIGGASCTPAPIGEADGELVIGTLLPLSGVSAEAGVAAREAIDARLSEIGAATEFDRIQIRVVHTDVRSDGALLNAAVDELTANNVDVVIGPDSNAQDAQVRQLLSTAGVVVHLSLAQPLEPQMEMMADAMVSDGHRQVSLMMPAGTDNSVPSALAEKLAENDGELLSQVSFVPTADRFDPEVALVAEDVSTAVLVIGAENPQRLLDQLNDAGAGPSGGRTVYVLGNSESVDPEPGLRLVKPAAPLPDRAVDRLVVTALAAAKAGTDDPATIASKLADVVEGDTPCSTFANCLSALRESDQVLFSGRANNGFTADGIATAVPYSLNAYTIDGELNEDDSRAITSR